MNDDYNISQAFQRIEENLIKSMKRNLKNHLKEEDTLDINWSAWQSEQIKSLEQFKKSNKEIFKNDFSTINNEIEELIKKSYENGKLNQEKTILEAIKNGNFNSSDKEINKLWNIYKNTKNHRIKKKQLTRIYQKTNQTEANFFKINDRKLKALINETTENFKKAENSILRYSNDQYRKIIYDAQVYANTGSGTIEQAIDMATKDFLSKGINSIEYANGMKVNIASYAEMAIRTANKRAYLQGEGEKRTEWGVYTVLVPNRGGGCPYCIKFQGKIFIDDIWSNGTEAESKKTGYLLLSTAVKEKLFHPNCKDTIVTYFEGINTKPNIPTEKQLDVKKENYIIEQKQRYNERQIRKYKRLELGSTDKNNIEKYHKKRIEWQQYNKEFCENHNLKRKYDREDINGIINIEKSSENAIMEEPQYLKSKTITLDKNLNNVVDDAFDEFKNGNIISKLDETKVEKSNEKYSFYNRNTDTINIAKDSNKYEVIHEIAHVIETKNDIYNDEEFKGIINKTINNFNITDIIYDTDTFEKPIFRIDSQLFVTEYQGRLYQDIGFTLDNGKLNYKAFGDYFAEGVRIYFENKEILKNINIDLYSYIERILK